MEESLILTRTIRCAERVPGTTEESTALARQAGMAAVCLLELIEAASLEKKLASLQTGQADLEAGALLERLAAAGGAADPLTADESAELGRWGAVGLQSQSKLAEALTFSGSWLASAEGLQEETEANESVCLALMAGLAATTGTNANNGLILDAGRSIAGVGSLNDLEAAISLGRFSDTAGITEYSFEETLTADVSRTAEPAGQAQTQDSLSISAIRQEAWTDRLLLDDSLTLNVMRQGAFLGWTSTETGLLLEYRQNFSPTENISAMPRPDVFTLEAGLLTTRTFTSLVKTQAKFVTSITTSRSMEYER